jgi:phosphopantothenoylcysteine decarboxylase/phosphopantothenate--cysteine ligase
MPPRNRELILGVGGGISAYKAADLLRRLQDAGFLVTVIPTRSSLNFVGKATWEALSGREVHDDLWSNIKSVPHIALAKRAAAIVIAPTTADLLSRIAQGRADDLLTNTVIASSAPLVLVPAMHPEMWLNPATQANVQLLKSRGVHIVEPDTGRLTGADSGVGRFPESSRIVSELATILGSVADYAGKKVLISAGGTREAIDPVRYIGNHSSGKQGYALAQAAASRGAQVTLVAANVALPDIDGVKTIHVTSALEMQSELQSEFSECDLLIMSAAVADARPVDIADEKIGKDGLENIALIRNPDIVKELADAKSSHQVIVAFAAETGAGGLDRATAKLRAKGVDLLYCNDVSGGAIFNSETTSGTILESAGDHHQVSDISKDTLADQLLDLALNKLG